jgi:SAM-dependent methyltransferase
MNPIRETVKRWAQRTLPPSVFARLRSLSTRLRFRGLERGEVFTDIYKKNFWSDAESRSGSGSTLERTEELRKHLPGILARRGAKRMLDAGCGDFNWMREVDLGDVDYIGVDIVEPLIAENSRKFSRPRREFKTVDIVVGELPPADLVLCRDCLFHLPYKDVFQALANFRRTGAKWLLTTTFPDVEQNFDIPAGSYRPINLCRSPFGLPAPIEAVTEVDRQVALWEFESLRIDQC